MKHKLTFLLLMSFLSAPALADAVRSIQGNVIMARAGDAPLFVWNATPYVGQLVNDKVLGDAGMRALEATALNALAQKARALDQKTVGMRVIYEKTGAVSPLYQTATFEGMEDVVTLTADRKALEAGLSAWTSQIQAGATPKGLTLAVTGKLPPA
jgi:hypothetical protein